MLRVVIAAAVAAALPANPAQAQSAMPRATEASIARARADSLRRPYTKADIDFVNGMIHHHAQAIHMASMAPSHGASDDIRTLCARIVNAQQDEIRIMQQWLADRNQPVPTPNPYGMEMHMGGAHHIMLMPGMLSREELGKLDATWGPAFDLLLLQSMVRHHEGAVGMVKDLFATHAAGQDELVFRIASDIHVDQLTEIARMRKMIAGRIGG
jgi:uncharacterized protein (DUF305 family)